MTLEADVFCDGTWLPFRTIDVPAGQGVNFEFPAGYSAGWVRVKSDTACKATAQFNETSLHFATRLMEEEGWYYFFEHTSDSHTLVVTNDNNGFYTIPGATLRLGVAHEAPSSRFLTFVW